MINAQFFLTPNTRTDSPEQTSDDKHLFFFLGNITKEQFIEIIINQNIFKPKTCDKYLENITQCFLNRTEYNNSNELFLVKHFKYNNDNFYTTLPSTYPLVFMFFKSSEKWWNNLISLYDQIMLSGQYLPFHLHEIAEDMKHGNIYNETVFVTDIDFDYCVDFMNFCLHIDGWDDEDPPMQLINFGNDPLIVPRHIDPLLPEGEGLIISLKVNGGQIIDTIIKNPGFNYKINDVIEIYQTGAKNGRLFVTEVNTSGSVLKLLIQNSGFGYKSSGATVCFSNGHSRNSIYPDTPHNKLSYYIPLPTISVPLVYNK